MGECAGVTNDELKTELGEHLNTCKRCECVEPSNGDWNYCSQAGEIIDRGRNQRQKTILLAYVTDLHRQQMDLLTAELADAD